MKYKNCLGVWFLVLAVMLCFSNVVAASDPRFLSAYHAEYGVKLYNDGKINFSIERFIKALLLDSENVTAKDFLRKISQQGSSVLADRSVKISRLVDQIEYYNFLNLRCQSLISENSRLLTFIDKNLAKVPSLGQKVDAIKSAQADNPGIWPSVGKVGFENDDTKDINIDEIIMNFGQQKELLLSQIRFWEEQNNQLRLLRRSLLAGANSQNSVVVADKLKSEMVEIKNRAQEKDELLATQNQNIEYFQSELSNVRENFNLLQERFKSTDSKISDLTKKIAEMSMVILEKDKILDEKDLYAAKLQREMNEATEKLNLVQRIIQEKDDRISSLEKEAAQISKNINSQAGSVDPQIAELKTDLKLFEEQFKAQMEKSRDYIIDLRMQFVNLTQKYEVLVENMYAKDFLISALEGDLIKKDSVIEQYRDAFLITNQKANELLGMVDIYRSKLIEANRKLLFRENASTESKGSASDSENDSNQHNDFPDNFSHTFSKK